MDDDDQDCTKALLALYEFLDGELTAENRRNIAGHLDGCPHCFSAFDFEAELRIVVRSRVQVQLPPQLLARIAEAIEREARGRGFGPAGGLAPGRGPLGPSGSPSL
jgi:anti-sigma factor (TIGR02949 family)